MATLTPMQAFALDKLKEKKGGELHAGTLANDWTVHKTGRHPRCASRDRFGATAAAYKALRKLVDLGLAQPTRYGSTFTLK